MRVIAPRICVNEHCGREYTPTSNRQRYCTKKCHNKVRYQQRKANGTLSKPTPEQAAYYRRNEKVAHLKWHYNLTVEQYEALCKDGCHACGSFEKLHVDHDHNCCPGEKTCGNCVRGILCSACNLAEGHLKSDANRALALAAYLLKSTNVLEKI